MIISVCLCLIKYFFADVIVRKSSQVKPSQAKSSQVNDSPQEILLKKEKEACPKKTSVASPNLRMCTMLRMSTADDSSRSWW
jgi:hypothetical protein